MQEHEEHRRYGIPDGVELTDFQRTLVRLLAALDPELETPGVAGRGPTDGLRRLGRD